MVLALFPCDDIWRSTSTEDKNVKISSTRNPIFTEGWMLEYRGGWKNNKTSVKSSMDPDASFSSSESCVSYFQDVDEVFSHMLISDSSMQQIIGDGPSVQTKREEHYRNKSGRRRKQQHRGSHGIY
uniref:C2 domain-containing protein n=1 Tax=Heterorhabditis bacteriophora TaxID=37862 RepID=A0A1I7WGK7_HETBA